MMVSDLREQGNQHPTHCSKGIPHLRLRLLSLAATFCITIRGLIVVIVTPRVLLHCVHCNISRCVSFCLVPKLLEDPKNLQERSR